MKKRAAESDVRAMAAALGERQGGPLKNPPPGSNFDSSLEIRLTLINTSDKTEFTGDLYEGAEVTAQITKTSGDDTLFIGAIELVNQNAPTDTQQIFPEGTLDPSLPSSLELQLTSPQRQRALTLWRAVLLAH